MQFDEQIKSYIEEEIKLLGTMDIESVNKILNLLVEAYERESTIYVCGNGGSASTASHMANDFNKGISEHTDKKFHLCCLNDNIATVLAVANDIGYDEIFSFQLEGNVKEGDIVIGISGSGNSQNVINALECGKKNKATTIGWVGFDGGKVNKMADVIFHVEENNMQLVEDLHIILNHLLMYVIMKTWNIKAH